MATFGPYTFEELADFIGPVSKWPRDILETYNKPTYQTTDRLKLCLFNYVNGFDNRNFLEWAIQNLKLRDQAAINDVQHLTQVLEEGKLNQNTWFSFSIEENRWVYLDGTTKRRN